MIGVPAEVFEPDLIVTSDDGTDLLLLVEVKRDSTHLAETESQLRQYMLAMRCPIGLLATPHALRVYYDEYISATEDSVRLIGEYNAPSDWAHAGAGFEHAVHAWLEGLSAESGLRSLSHDVREAAEYYLVPALNQGTVRAAHPRAA